MNKLLSLLLFAVFFIPHSSIQKLSEKDLYRITLNQHRFANRKLTVEQLHAIPKKDRPDLAWEQDYLATMDPATGRPAPERLFPVYNQIAQAQKHTMSTPGGISSPWVERGPSNVAGRTRAIAYDPADPNGTKVWAGGVTGGLWYTNDISSSSSPWVAVNDFWDNIAVSAIAFDPTDSDVIYVGTGEGWGAGASRGGGIWKSTNGGSTWTHLSATTSFYYVNDLVVRNESGNGVLYVGIRGNYYGGSWHGSAAQGLQRSTNGGTSFTQVLPSVPGQSFNYVAADLELSANNTLWVGTTTSSYGGTDRGGGRILKSTNGTTWTVEHTSSGGERVEVACAPSDANYVYAIIESSNEVDAIVKTTNGGTTWSSLNEPNDADPGIPSTDFSRGQAWYDLILAVDPNNRNRVIAGAVDLFKTTNGGTSWSQISHWYGGFSYPNVHADQHAIVFKPGSSTEALFGNDGGIYRTTNATSTSPSFTNKNNGYNITQFYACAIHPTAGTDYFLAGSQDNGSQQFNASSINSTTEVTGGDGAYCFIDQTNPNYQITSYVYNSYWLSTNAGATFGSSRIQSDQNTGKFINPTDYDDNQDALYSARTTSTINRITNISGSPSISNFSISGLSSMASHLRVSPYTTSSTTLFVGTEAGDLYKVTNADGSSPSSSSIGGSLPAGNISCVEIGASENQLLVTYSNYGMTSVWYTSNGGSTWSSKEGNLPDMPIRWALFNPNDRDEVILATEVGVWSTSNFSASSPSWTASSSGLANVRVDMLQLRQSDYEVIAATHGRGLFSSNGFVASTAPAANLGYSTGFPCTGETVQLGDSSSGNPTSWNWTITPNTYSFASGSNATNQNPEVVFNAPGWYTIKLVATNGNGSDSISVSQAIRAGGHELPFTEDFENGSTVSRWSVNNPDNSTTWTWYTGILGTSPGNKAIGIDNYGYNAPNQRDDLLTPALDLSGYTQATLTFEYAYRRYSAANQDSLAVFVSTNCGTSWTRVASFKENGSSTGPGNFTTGSDYTSGAFFPGSGADWCGATGNPSCPSIDLSAFTGNANVRIAFENINGWGNNMFIDNVNITGSVGAAPLADFNASSTSTCTGDTVLFTDLSTNLPSGWAWSFTPSTVTFVNGTSASSQNPEVQFNSAGTYQARLIANNSVGADTAIKSSYISVNTTVTPSVAISSSDTTICSGTSVNFMASPVNGGSAPIYQWKVNGTNVGSNSASFTSSVLSNSDVVTVQMQSNATCPTAAVVNSGSITMNVLQTVTPSASISASQNSICAGDTVVFTATTSGGGSNPAYQWKINGTNAGSNSATFSSHTLSSSDVVTLAMTSSESCATTSTVTSNSVSITVNSAVAPSVSVSSNDTLICAGSPASFTATASNAGSNPSYQWKVNGSNAGSNSPFYNSSNLSNNDVVTCQVTSSLGCALPTQAMSSAISITVIQDPTVTITTPMPMIPLCAGDTMSLTGTVNGHGRIFTDNWTGPGVQGNKFIPVIAGTGTHTIYYGAAYLNSPTCTGYDTLQIPVEIVPKPTINANGMTLSCAQSGFNYQWIKNGNTIPGATSQNYTVTGNGNYSVQIGLSSCSDQSDPYSIVNFSMDEMKAAVGFQLYPNPTDDQVWFELTNPGARQISYELIATNGAVLLRNEISAEANIQEQVDLSRFASGIYTLKIKTGEYEFTERIGKH